MLCQRGCRRGHYAKYFPCSQPQTNKNPSLDFDIAFPGSNSTDGSHCHSVTRNIPGNGLVPKRSPIIGFTCDDEGIYSSSLRSNEDPAKHPNAAYELAINYDDYYSTPYSATFSIGDLFLHKGMVDTVEVPAGSGKKWQVIDQAGPLVFGQQTVPYP